MCIFLLYVVMIAVLLYSALAGACIYIIRRMEKAKNRKASTIIDKSIPQKRCIAPQIFPPQNGRHMDSPKVCVPLLGHGGAGTDAKKSKQVHAIQHRFYKKESDVYE